MSSIQSIEDLLDAKIAWIKEVGLPRWRAFCAGEKCELTMNNFPEEALYTLKWRESSLDIDDSPTSWSIPRAVTRRGFCMTLGRRAAME